MITPQEIQERSETLEKAVFGGYSMSSVEDLLTSLASDYASLYQENASLKNKIKSQNERIEKYREQEDAINRALLMAQKTSDDLVSETQRKCTRMISDTESKLRQRRDELEQEVAAETERVNQAKQSAAKFVVELENRVQEQLSQLEHIKQMDLTVQSGEARTMPKKASKLPTAEKKPAEPAEKVSAAQKAAARPRTAETAAKPAPEQPAASVMQAILNQEIKKQTPAEPEGADMARQIEDSISRILAQGTQQAANKEELGDTRVIDPVG